MDLKRFFIDKIDGNVATLTGEEFFHAVKVTRHKVGFELILCDNSGNDYYATITAINKDNLVAKVDKTERNSTEIDSEINLFIGMNKDIDSVVQKAVELGITSVTPFYSQHTSIDKEVNTSRLEKIVLESSKQCGRAKLMKVNTPINFQDITMINFDNTLFFYEYERISKVSDCAITITNPINIIIGSEGGFSIEEVALLASKGAQTLTLGKRILRVSTAVVSAISLVLQKIGEM